MRHRNRWVASAVYVGRTKYMGALCFENGMIPVRKKKWKHKTTCSISSYWAEIYYRWSLLAWYKDHCPTISNVITFSGGNHIHIPFLYTWFILCNYIVLVVNIAQILTLNNHQKSKISFHFQAHITCMLYKNTHIYFLIMMTATILLKYC